MKDNSLEDRIREWQAVAFPDATPESILRHLSEEIRELDYAVRSHYMPDVVEEIGDMGLLLSNLASKYGRTLEVCMRDKFETASIRKYAYDPKLGYSKHVDEKS